MYIIIKYRCDLPYFDLVAIVRSFEQDEQMKLVDIYMDPILPASYYIYMYAFMEEIRPLSFCTSHFI